MKLDPAKLRVLFVCALAAVAITRLTSVSYANAFTIGMTRMFFPVAIAIFITALVLDAGMRRGLHASLAVPIAAGDAAVASPEAQ